jgi:microcystin-dependent protein
MFMGVLFGGLAVQAGVPEKVVYQGRLSRSGAAVTEKQLIKVTLIDPNGVESPQIVFSSLVTLAATGEFSILLNMPASYDWERAAPELEVEVGGEVLTPREKINVSPYAFLAKKVATGGVSSAAIGAGQVQDVHVSTISAAKIMLPGTASPITVWQSTVAGHLDKIDSAKVYGTILSAPAAHQGSHLAGGSDPIGGLQPTQVAGTAVVRSTSTAQTIQATADVVPLAIKPNPSVPAGSINVLEVYDTALSTSVTVRGDGAISAKGPLTVNSRIKDVSGFLVPVGTVVPFAGIVIPQGWLACDGTLYAMASRPDLNELRQALGSTYGGDGVSNFKVPDLRGRTAIGTGLGAGLTNRTLAQTLGEETHILTKSEMPSHDHNPGGGFFQLLRHTGLNTTASLDNADPAGTEPDISTSRPIGPEGQDQPHNNMPPSLALNYIIKY